MLPVVVLDYVGMAEGGEDGEFRGELGAFAVRHAAVGDFFAAEDAVGGEVAHFADDAEGALA